MLEYIVFYVCLILFLSDEPQTLYMIFSPVEGPYSVEIGSGWLLLCLAVLVVFVAIDTPKVIRQVLDMREVFYPKWFQGSRFYHHRKRRLL